MTYLYGDSTESGLELNYIELLREFLDFAVQLLLSEQRIANSILGGNDHLRQAEEESERLAEMTSSLHRVLDQAITGNPHSQTDQCAATFRQVIDTTTKRAKEELEQNLQRVREQCEVATRRERAGNSRLIERLLLDHQLPDSQSLVQLAWNPGVEQYDAEIHGRSQQGLSWRLHAEIPKDHLFSKPVRVSSVMESLIIELPETSGFVRKSVKLKPFRVHPLFITGLVQGGGKELVQMHASPDEGEDSGLTIRRDRSEANGTRSGNLQVQRFHRGEEQEYFSLSEADAALTNEFCDQVFEIAQGLCEERERVLEVRFQEQPLRSCENPIALLEAMIARIGPVIRDIADHSLGGQELVLKRILANDRREEIFASKEELRKTIGAVSPELRGIFDPLGLGEPEEDIDYDPTTQLPFDEPTGVQGDTQNSLNGITIPNPHEHPDPHEHEEVVTTIQQLPSEAQVESAVSSKVRVQLEADTVPPEPQTRPRVGPSDRTTRPQEAQAEPNPGPRPEPRPPKLPHKRLARRPKPRGTRNPPNEAEAVADSIDRAIDGLEEK